MLCLLATAAAPLAAPLPQFTDASPVLDAFWSVEDLVAADVDGDGVADLVVLDRAGTRVSWLRSRPSASFEPMVEVVRPSGPVGLAPRFGPLAAVDLDQDGDEDVVGLLLDELVAFESDGSALGPPLPIVGVPMPGSPDEYDLEVGDVDGDGRDDLVLLRRVPGGAPSTLRVLRSTGAGAFGAPEPVLASAPPIEAVTLADADGDGDLDVLYLAALGPTQSELRLARSVGAWPTPADEQVAVLPGRADGDLAAGDVDGDGHVDIATTTASFRHLTPGGAAGFGATSTFFEGGAVVRRLELRDVDLDGDLDQLELATEGAAPRWRANVGSTFAAPQPLGTEVDGERGLVVADIDGDLAPDVVHCAPDDVPRALGNDPNAANPLAGPSRTARPQIASPGRFVFGDVDGDGDMDVFTAGRAAGEVHLLTNRGAGQTFDVATVVDEVTAEAIRAGDLDGDGRADLVTVGDGLEVRRGLADGTLAPPVSTPIAPLLSVRSIPGFADVDGDGALDVVVAGALVGGEQGMVLYRGDGSGALSGGQTIWGGGPPGFDTTHVADVDGDGAPDLVAAVSGAAGVLVRLQDPQGGFAPPIALGDPLGVHGLALADLDGDGDLEVITTEGQGAMRTTFVHPFTGPGFGAPVPIPAVPSLGTLGGADDVDGDGDVDLFGTVPGLELVVFVCEGDAGAPNGFAQGVTFEPGPRDGCLLAPADLDRDGDMEFVYTIDLESEIGAVRNLRLGSVGAPFCEQPGPNSSGRVGALSMGGSASAAGGPLTARATGLPPGELAMLLCSETQASPTTPPGASGSLCLGGDVGRFDRPGELLVASPTGEAYIGIDLTALPTPGGTASAMAGETWNFQVWHRDGPQGPGASGFTTAVSVTLE